MRGLTKLYTYACEDLGCVSNSELVRYFTALDYMDDLETAYPTCLDLRQNYLGDPGAAACFRVLPYMLWIRRIEAAKIGCGPLGVQALCAALALRTAPASFFQSKKNLRGVDLLPSFTPAGSISTSMAAAPADGDDQMRENGDGRFAVIPFEYIDLSGNPIYAYTAGKLLKAIRMRRDWLWRCYGKETGGVERPPPLQLVLDWDVLPKRTVVRLQSLASGGLDGHSISHSHNSTLPHHIPEKSDHTVYRILTALPPDDNNRDLYYTQFISTNPFLGTLVRQINENMKDYLFASYHIEPSTDNDEPLDTVVPATAYFCVEYGVDLLSFLITQSTISGIPMTSLASSSNRREKIVHDRIVGRVRVLLQALDATPQFLQEALARDHDGPLLSYYLDRLKTSFHQISSYSVSSSTDSSTWALPQDLEVLYHRVVSSLVCRRMKWTLLPAIETSEARIEEIKKYMLDYLLDGAYSPPTFKANLPNLEDANHQNFFCGALTRWCVQAMYHIHNEPQSHDEWNRIYKSMFRRPFETSSSDIFDQKEDYYILDFSRSVSDEMQEDETYPRHVEERNGGVCGFAQECRSVDFAIPKPPIDEKGGKGRTTMPFPPGKHCQLALRTLCKVLEDPYTTKRLEVVAPLQNALPVEIRHFLVDLLICQNCQKDTGGPYMTALFGEPSLLESFIPLNETAASEVSDPEMEVEGSFQMIGWSLIDVLAVLYNRKDRLIELLKAFTEWYRLRTIESLVSRA
ncbi:unnamed protein product [Phytomonas sp. Hart1]|nr:unnamed protein product [Phytomonas sp. Hart1]|eukprot:CCW65937.1 unnamed protein product [Phytomonas sp. isolate Hart1]